MHNLQELTRQYDNAKGRAQVASDAEDAALERLKDALIAERLAILAKDGIGLGSIVDAFETPYRGRPERHLGRFVVLGAGMRFRGSTKLEDARAILGKLKNDGSPGKQPTNVPAWYDRLALAEEEK